ncbi:transcriptional regulator [Hoeflea sp. TYP-13]|uniref:transcriptional regulator n=1 Tax=Hoeflea sp. TYP-13 TaxID=3230023 RepID=UPI0034C5B80D
MKKPGHMPKKALSYIGFATVYLFSFMPSAWSAELLMLEQDGCVWCERWDEEIGDIYPKTDESKLAPLRRVDIDEKWPDDLQFVAREAFTPTFVLINDGEEIGRMRGYAGDEFFWVLLAEMLEKLPQ